MNDHAKVPDLLATDLYREPNALASSYSRFRVDQRLLLTGHSHQAWPDCALAGQQRAWEDAAELVDDKWERAFAEADKVREGFRRLVGDPDGHYNLAANTHDLLVRFLSALPLAQRPKLVATDGEFHTIRRQFDRLEEENWVEIVRVSADEPDLLAERLSAEVDDRTAAVLVSSVLFQSSRLVPGLDGVMAAAERHGAEFLVDTYHTLNAVPMDLVAEGLANAFVLGGGYKYCQLGEGCCFLRTPPGCTLRPVITGWFAEFDALAEADREPRVAYNAGPWRFAGATYDPTSHYRAADVFDFFVERGLTPELLREVSQHQVGLLTAAFDGLDLDPAILRRDRSVDLSRVGGFLVLTGPRAGEISQALRQHGVFTDSRGPNLRLGPAPYLCDRQLNDAIGLLGETARQVG